MQASTVAMQMPQFSAAQISESRAEASSMLSRQPRLESRDGNGAGGAAGQPPGPYHPHMMAQQPMLGGDVGVYIKWALLLQEQLDHVQGERAKLQQQVTLLQGENQQLRSALTSTGGAEAGGSDVALAGSAADAPGAARTTGASQSDRDRAAAQNALLVKPISLDSGFFADLLNEAKCQRNG